jgi:hypothetical protein
MENDTVTVSCSHHGGMILRVFSGDPEDDRQFVVDGPRGHDRKGVNTSGIPRDFWELWYEENRNERYVVNGLISLVS